MGLDISVYKVIPVEKENAQRIEDFYVLRKFKELVPIFKNLAFTKVNKYYKIHEAIKNKGYTVKQLECTGMSYGPKFEYSFHDKMDPLYKPYKWLDKVWSETYFNKLSELQENKHYKKFEADFKELLIQNGWVEKYKFYVSGQKKYQYNLVKAWQFCRKAISVSIKNPPLFSKTEKCIAIEEVGYQRKGANSQFYEDGMWSSKCVTDLKTLKEHWKKYFSEQSPDSKGGFGSGVEYKLENEEMKKRFKENIIDKFVEGETFVIYH